MARGARLKQTVAASYIDAHGEKYTDGALAQRAGVSVNTVRNLWHGRNAEVSTLLGVATASGMSILDLLTAMQASPAAPDRMGRPPVAQRLQAGSGASSAVADAIDRQTEMLRSILERMAPVESLRPTADEAATLEQEEAERDRRAADMPHHAGRQTDGAE